MKTTEDEKRIIEMYHTTIHQLTSYRNSYVELDKLADDYLRTLKSVSMIGMQLGDLFVRIAAEQSSSDIEYDFIAFGKAFKETEQKREAVARAFFDEIFVPVKKYLATDKQNVENVVSVASRQTKEAKSNIKKAEAKSKKFSRDPTKLQQSIQELNKRLQEAQEIHMRSLKSALTLQRGKYCSVAAHMAVVMDKIKEVHQAEENLLQQHSKMRELGKQTKNISNDIAELCKKKIRTLIDLTKISSTWKTIFKEAGVKKSDLRDAETAKYIIATIEKATGQKIDLPMGDDFSGYDDGSGYDDDVPPPPPPPRNIPPPPPRGPKPEPVSGGFGEPAQQEEEEEEETIEYEYVPPAPAPPVPGAPAAPSAPVPGAPAAPSGRSGLLSQIQQGTSLRKVERAPAELPEVENASDITSILKNAMATRRTAVVDDQDDNDDDEWSD